ncbi:hypothetical protein VTN77DRAFT_1899 [Rasamsonia byssochlamydoides]|uniref:uncharacterized protein n=1 Tax=Rasamsonia byssochlamydoides TaxID=89139 RepID=UPI0037441EBF
MAAAQLQALLRFLSQDAKVPLATAMGKVKKLQEAGLRSADEISKSELKTLQDVFKDEKTAKQVLNAAKRTAKSKKRAAPDDSLAADSSLSSSKKMKTKVELGSDATPFQIESSLALPISTASEEELSKTVLLTNRAPLVLAFAVCVTKYTMPEQPISSRLSLAQTVVSANSRSKAVSLGIESGKSAEEEGWGQGQPTVKVLGREIPVLKRWDYDPKEGQPKDDTPTEATKEKSDAIEDSDSSHSPPLWGLDLDSLRKRSSERGPSSGYGNTTGLPIHTPESARAYLLKSFTIFQKQGAEKGQHSPSASSPKKQKEKKTDPSSEKEKCLGLLLQAIDIVCRSWASTLSAEELDQRAWSWYLRVRPDVQTGVAGWGEKGKVKLADILALKRA